MQKTMMTFLLSSMLLGCQQTEVDLQSNIQLPDVYQYARLERGRQSSKIGGKVGKIHNLAV